MIKMESWYLRESGIQSDFITYFKTLHKAIMQPIDHRTEGEDFLFLTKGSLPNAGCCLSNT